MSLLDLIYPKICQNCKSSIDHDHTFCKECLSQLTLIHPMGRCQKCFGEMNINYGTCKPCRKLHHSLKRVGACFEHFGPAANLVSNYRRGRYYFAKDIAAFLMIQLNHLNWGDLDCIVPIPTKETNLIAQELSKMTSKPVHHLLKRRGGIEAEFSIKKRCNISFQNVLSVDLTSRSRKTLRAAGKTLIESWPCHVYGITFTLFS